MVDTPTNIPRLIYQPPTDTDFPPTKQPFLQNALHEAWFIDLRDRDWADDESTNNETK